MPRNLPAEEELLHQLSKGGKLAFEEIYHLYRDKIWSLALRLTESPYYAEEIVQEVFIKLWLYRHNLERVENFQAWLYAVARNLVVDTMKRMAREVVARKELNDLMGKTENNDGESVAIVREHERLMEKAIAQLSPQQKLVYRLSREGGLGNQEIALKLQISNKTVKNHLTNSMRTIRKYFSIKMGAKYF